MTVKWNNDTKATLTGFIALIVMSLKTFFGINIPADIEKEFLGVILFVIGYLANKPNKEIEIEKDKSDTNSK